MGSRWWSTGVCKTFGSGIGLREAVEVDAAYLRGLESYFKCESGPSKARVMAWAKVGSRVRTPVQKSG